MLSALCQRQDVGADRGKVREMRGKMDRAEQLSMYQASEEIKGRVQEGEGEGRAAPPEMKGRAMRMDRPHPPRGQ